jgi:hypothetical protein
MEELQLALDDLADMQRLLEGNRGGSVSQACWRTSSPSEIVEDTIGGMWGSTPDSGKQDEADVLVVRGAARSRLLWPSNHRVAQRASNR